MPLTRPLSLACGTLTLLALSLASLAQQPAPATARTTQQAARLQSAYGHLPLSFEPNRGQTDPQVQFLARTPAATVYLTGADAVIQTSSFKKDGRGTSHLEGSSAVRMHLAGATTTPTAAAEQPLPGTMNYMRGNDRSKWATDVPTYGGVRLASVYPGVDLRYYGHTGQLEYDFIVAPQADASNVKLQFDGASAKVEPNGDLVLPVAHGTDLRFDKPVAYQSVGGKRTAVDASFELAANHDVTFRLGPYDHTRELVIDPTLVYLGTLGNGVAQNNVNQITVDSAGALYFIGTSNDPAFPVTPGAYQTVCGPSNATAAANGVTYCNGNYTSAFITKLSADGTQLVYSTYLSGHGGVESGNAIAVDSAGVAYLFGMTGSDDFPITSDAFQKRCNAFYGAFGAPNPVPCDGYYNGGGTQYTIANTDAYFAKLNATGSALLYSSFLGSDAPVYPAAVGLDGSGNIYLYGQTVNQSVSNQKAGHAQFPGLTSSGYQLTSTAITDGNTTCCYSINNAPFVDKFSNDGRTLIYGTFFNDNVSAYPMYPTAMAVGSTGIAYIGGYSSAANQNDTAGTLKTACTASNGGGGCTTYDGFLAAIDTSKSGAASLQWATRIGGSDTTSGSNIPNQEILGLALDSSSNIYVTGYTFDHTFPVGTGGYQSTCLNYSSSQPFDYCNSAFVIKVNPTGTKVLGGSFLVGPNFRSAATTGYNVRLDSKGQVYVYGQSNDGGGDFPIVNPLQGYKGGNQLFIATFSADFSKLLFSTRFGNPSYTDHSVSPAGGMVLDPSDNIYFAGTTTDTMFAGTTGTYNTATTTGQGAHAFFAKVSKVLQPDTTVLTITPNPANAGSTVTYKAVVTGTQQTTPVATGTVTFSATSTTPATVLGTATLDATGTATLTTSAPAAGTYTVVATYGADNIYDVSTSTAATLTVKAVTATTTTLTATPASARLGAAVMLNATVAGAGGTPTGTVTFLDGTTTLATVTLTNGAATYSTSSLTATAHSITARYSGDTTFGGSTSAVQTETVSTNSVSIGLTATPTLSPTGGTVTLTAALTNPTSTTAPTGMITFYNNGTSSLGVVTVSNNGASLTTTALPAGTATITAVYSGDTLYGTATSASQTVVVRAAAATTTTVSASPAAANLGATVTLTAAVSSTVTTGSPTGTVTFKDGTTTLGTGTVANGAATFMTTSLASGSHSITAGYSGDSLFLTSTSTAATVTVATPSLVITANPNPVTVVHGQSVTITLTYTPSGGFAGTVTPRCTGLPAFVSCTFNPASQTFTATSGPTTGTLTIATSQKQASLTMPHLPGSGSGVSLAMLFWLPGMGLALAGLRRRGTRTRMKGLLLAVLLCCGLGSVTALTGCGTTDVFNSATPGTYAVTVTTDTTGATATTPLNLSVVIQ